MTAQQDAGDNRRRNPRRMAAWALAVLLWLLPLAAMQVTDEVNWGPGDLLIAGILIGGCGLALEFAVRCSGDIVYRVAAGVAVVAAFILVWMSIGVGVIGRDGDPANLMYFGVLAVGIIGAVIARFQPHGMARALVATALAQGVVTAIALVARLGAPWSDPANLILLNGFFVGLFVASALLFQRAARRIALGGPSQGSTGAGVR